MIDTLLEDGTFSKDFNNLCNNKFVNGSGFPGGCAMFVMQFQGGDDRIISKYGFSVSVELNFV